MKYSLLIKDSMIGEMIKLYGKNIRLVDAFKKYVTTQKEGDFYANN